MKSTAEKLSQTNTRKNTGLILISLTALLACTAASLALGSRTVSLNEVIDGLFYRDAGSFGAIVVRERIPRTVFSLIAGAALGISGALMQAITRNPIADPSILGVNTGASLLVVCGIAFLNITTAHQYIWLALAGAGVTAVFVYSVGSMGRGGATPIKLTLAGAATSAALSSIVSTVMLPRTNVMDDFRFWQVGSVGGATWHNILIMAPFFITGIIISLLAAPALNALAMGDDAAKGLGIKPGFIRTIAALAGVCLCGATTALAGPIAFVGLMAPHMMRSLIGADQRIIIPMSAVSGAVVLTISDVIGRLLGSPGELEVGIVTAFIGAPVLIIIAMKSKVRSL